jgi:hypothetical protein
MREVHTCVRLHCRSMDRTFDLIVQIDMISVDVDDRFLRTANNCIRLASVLVVVDENGIICLRPVSMHVV